MIDVIIVRRTTSIEHIPGALVSLSLSSHENGMFSVHQTHRMALIIMIFSKLFLYIFAGKSDYCSAIGETGVAEKQICGTQESFKSRAINVYSHGIPNGVTQCICKVDLPSSIKYLSVGYYINSSGKDGCGLKVNLGNSGSFSCRSQRHANVSRFNDIRFSRASDSSPNMCLEIRSGNEFSVVI